MTWTSKELDRSQNTSIEKMRDDKLPNLRDLALSGEAEQHAVIARLFEDSQELLNVVTPLLSSTTPDTYELCISRVRQELKSLAPSLHKPADPSNVANHRRLDAILNAHPRLGEKKANLSASSAAEQANLQSSTDQAQAKELDRLNTEYETRFEGLRYLVFVNGRGRPEVFDDMRRRIDRGDAWAERMEAVDALCDIAADRVQKIGVANSVKQ